MKATSRPISLSARELKDQRWRDSKLLQVRRWIHTYIEGKLTQECSVCYEYRHFHKINCTILRSTKRNRRKTWRRKTRMRRKSVEVSTIPEKVAMIHTAILREMTRMASETGTRYNTTAPTATSPAGSSLHCRRCQHSPCHQSHLLLLRRPSGCSCHRPRR